MRSRLLCEREKDCIASYIVCMAKSTITLFGRGEMNHPNTKERFASAKHTFRTPKM